MEDSASTTAELLVGGMHCQSCAALIEEILGREPAVRRATVDFDTARASVTYDRAVLSIDDVCAAITNAGYRATPLVSTDPGV